MRNQRSPGLDDNGRFLAFLRDTIADLKKLAVESEAWRRKHEAEQAEWRRKHEAEQAEWQRKHEAEQRKHEAEQIRWQEEHEERVRMINNDLLQLGIITSRIVRELGELEKRTNRNSEVLARAIRALLARKK